MKEQGKTLQEWCRIVDIEGKYQNSEYQTNKEIMFRNRCIELCVERFLVEGIDLAGWHITDRPQDCNEIEVFSFINEEQEQSANFRIVKDRVYEGQGFVAIPAYLRSIDCHMVSILTNTLREAIQKSSGLRHMVDMANFRDRLIDLLLSTTEQSVIAGYDDEFLFLRDTLLGFDSDIQIPLSALYEQYTEGAPIEDLAAFSLQSLFDSPAYTAYLDKALKDLIASGETTKRVVASLMITEENLPLLHTVPHREFFDMSMVYNVFLLHKDGQVYAKLITNEMLEKLHISETELFCHALKNTRYLYLPKIEMVDEKLEKLKEQEESCQKDCVPCLMRYMSDELASIMSDVDVFVITTDERYGAYSLLFGDALQVLSEELEDDLIVVPLNPHILLAIGALSSIEPDLSRLSHILISGNRNSKNPCAILSNNLYYYDWEEKILDTISLDDEDNEQFVDMSDPYNPVFHVGTMEVLPDSVVRKLIPNGGLVRYYLIEPDGDTLIQEGYNPDDILAKIDNGCFIGRETTS